MDHVFITNFSHVEFHYLTHTFTYHRAGCSNGRLSYCKTTFYSSPKVQCFSLSHLAHGFYGLWQRLKTLVCFLWQLSWGSLRISIGFTAHQKIHIFSLRCKHGRFLLLGFCPRFQCILPRARLKHGSLSLDQVNLSPKKLRRAASLSIFSGPQLSHRLLQILSHQLWGKSNPKKKSFKKNEEEKSIPFARV